VKVLNLYAGIGGNRKLWGGCDVTSVENVDYIADAYEKMFPQDTLIREDAHQYLIEHFSEYDFIWSSPPCPTHSRLNDAIPTERKRYPDMKLYEEIIFLKHYFQGHWVVENVVSYYDPLIAPTASIARHYFWSNFHIEPMQLPQNPDISRSSYKELAEYHGIELPEGTKDQRKLYRNAVNPLLGKHVFDSRPVQASLLQEFVS
jgi:DNA (cytosine-5)-methyltransferase 1